MRLNVIRSNYNAAVSKFLIKYVVIFDFMTETSSKLQKIIGKHISNQNRKITYMVPFIFGTFGEPPCVKERFFHRVSVYEPGTIDVNKMLTSLSTIIDRWNETCLNQESSGQVRFKKILFHIFVKFF